MTCKEQNKILNDKIESNFFTMSSINNFKNVFPYLIILILLINIINNIVKVPRLLLKLK